MSSLIFHQRLDETVRPSDYVHGPLLEMVFLYEPRGCFSFCMYMLLYVTAFFALYSVVAGTYEFDLINFLAGRITSPKAHIPENDFFLLNLVK